MIRRTPPPPSGPTAGRGDVVTRRRRDPARRRGRHPPTGLPVTTARGRSVSANGTAHALANRPTRRLAAPARAFWSATTSGTRQSTAASDARRTGEATQRQHDVRAASSNQPDGLEEGPDQAPCRRDVVPGRDDAAGPDRAARSARSPRRGPDRSRSPVRHRRSGCCRRRGPAPPALGRRRCRARRGPPSRLRRHRPARSHRRRARPGRRALRATDNRMPTPNIVINSDEPP